MPKIITKLSEKKILNAPPKKEPYKLYDEGGLRLLVRPSGTKVWQYPYVFHGKTNTYTIGKYCPKGRAGYVGTAQARKVRDEIKALIESGIDPNKHKQTQRFNSEEKSKTTFEAIGREWHEKGVWVEKHKKNILRSLEDDVFPVIGYKQINQVTAVDIIQVLAKVEDRGAIDVAKRICQRCEDIFSSDIISHSRTPHHLRCAALAEKLHIRTSRDIPSTICFSIRINKNPYQSCQRCVKNNASNNFYAFNDCARSGK